MQKLVALTKRGADDPIIRDRVAQEWIELQALKMTNYRSLTTLMQTGIPGPEGSVSKLHWSEQNQRLTKLAMEILEGEDDGYWRHQQLRSRGNTIEAGTSEILRNIIAERVLGLPRAADAIRLHRRAGAAPPRGARRAPERRLEPRRRSPPPSSLRRPGRPLRGGRARERRRVALRRAARRTSVSRCSRSRRSESARRRSTSRSSTRRTASSSGRKIGVYQAVSHQLADTFVETELARSLAYWAAWCVAEGDDQAPIAVAAAKAYAGDAAVAA